jgi:hypothetical protein
LARLAKGIEASGNAVDIHHLALPRDAKTAPESFASAERFVLGFPLYTDAMPGQVMDFIERLEGFRGRPGNPPIAFLVQSGFPEAGHSRAMERYLEKLAVRLGSRYLGTIVKGGGAGAQDPDARKWLPHLETLGRQLGDTDRFDPGTLRELAGPEWFPRWQHFLVRLALRLTVNRQCDKVLKKNGVFERRMDRPYELSP